jgi:hypothetical protein
MDTCQSPGDNMKKANKNHLNRQTVEGKVFMLWVPQGIAQRHSLVRCHIVRRLPYYLANHECRTCIEVCLIITISKA